jgi:hypothetical protein
MSMAWKSKISVAVTVYIRESEELLDGIEVEPDSINMLGYLLS